MNENTFSKNIANAITSFLNTEKWHFTFDEQRGLFYFGLRLKGKIKSINYVVDISEDDYRVVAFSPLSVDYDDKKMMTTMAEFICRANYGLKGGDFEFDMQDGEICFRYFVDCKSITPSKEMVMNSIFCPATTFDHYSPGIVAIIMGDATAKDAIAKCEKVYTEESRTILGEEPDNHENIEVMNGRLAEKLGIDEKETYSSSEKTESPGDEITVNPDPFKTKGGVS